MSAAFAERMLAIVRPPSKMSCVIEIVADSLVIVLRLNVPNGGRVGDGKAVGVGKANGASPTAASGCSPKTTFRL